MDRLFTLICFLCLMQDRDLPLEKHFDYILEKSSMLNSDIRAYTALDRKNQQNVLQYYLKYHLDLPKEIQEYEKDFMNYMYGDEK